jgi:hypothetical protein
MKTALPIMSAIILSGCGVFGGQTVEIAPYDVLYKQDQYELRHYESLVLITTLMDSKHSEKSAFSNLFDYISGNNKSNKKIAMTAPVFMDKNNDNPDNNTMSFVLPTDFSIETTPIPIDDTVKIEEIKDYTVATIQFNGRLQKDNISKHDDMLREWIKKQKYIIAGEAQTAGYNAPFTIPTFRRNEILIPVQKPE